MKKQKNKTLINTKKILFFSLIAFSLHNLQCAAPQGAMLIQHLFGEKNQSTVSRLTDVAEKIDTLIIQARDYRTACMQEVRIFLYNELIATFNGIAAHQNNTEGAAQFHAREFMKVNIEGPFLARFKQNLFDQDPLALPQGIFAVYISESLIDTFSPIRLPLACRSSIDRYYIHYLIKLRYLLNCAATAVDIATYALTSIDLLQSDPYLNPYKNIAL